MRRALIPLVLVLVCATAHAEKRRKTAAILSAGGAAVAGAVVLTGFLTTPEGDAFNLPVLYTGVGLLFVTPSLGQFYAGQYLTWGMGIRAAGAGLAYYALQTQTELVQCDTARSSTDPPCKSLSESALPMLGIAAIGFIGGVWWDALDAGDAADRYNAKHAVTVQPTVQTTAQGFTLGLAGRF